MSDSTQDSLSEERRIAREHLIKLIMNQDHVSQNWVKFFFALQAGLVAVTGFILKSFYGQIGGWSRAGLACFGILSAIVIALIIFRERNWQRAYVEKYTKSEKPGDAARPEGSLVFPKDGVSFRPEGAISRLIRVVVVLLVIGWVAYGMIGVFYKAPEPATRTITRQTPTSQPSR